MTPEQQAVYIQSQATCALIGALGMISSNLAAMGTVPRSEQDFLDLINRYGIHHNAAVGMFTGR